MGKAISIRVWLAVSLLLSLASQCGSAATDSPQTYLLHPGDELLVGVFDDPKLPPQKITIAPDGTFSFPLVGRVVASGKSAEQLREELAIRLKKYVTEPSVIVTISDVKGDVAYVIGQVNKPGVIEMNPTINVMQALSVTGGLNPYAKGDGIIVIRGGSSGQQVLHFHYGQVISGKALEQNVELQSGDVVVVP
ncbi:MAG TPA: polysaccharide biosynthesis/export family protein [Steroidobacteraceae bacterium]|jgi:polysaccharide export outer membrane protein|nr:polysaccharide biosynthesis/export family protein [Steroidobacteraceae bacterium]